VAKPPGIAASSWRGAAPTFAERGLERVNAPLSIGDLQRMRRSVSRGRPSGGEAWTKELAISLELDPSRKTTETMAVTRYVPLFSLGSFPA
jgi:hypothetical protein